MMERAFKPGDYSEIADNIAKNGLNIYRFAIVAKKSTLLKISQTEGVDYIVTKPME